MMEMQLLKWTVVLLPSLAIGLAVGARDWKLKRAATIGCCLWAAWWAISYYVILPEVR